jgi:hypothetical protein
MNPVTDATTSAPTPEEMANPKKRKNVIPTVKAVKCIDCEALFDAVSDKFVTFHGNFTKGLSDGVIGNNFDEDGTLKNVSILCIPCFKNKLLQQVVNPEYVTPR